MRNSLIALSALLLSVVVASAAEQVPNPAYTCWTQFKPGSWSKLQGSMAMKIGDKDVKTTMSITRKLVEITPQKAVVELIITATVDGEAQEIPSRKMEVPATIDADKADLAAILQDPVTQAELTDVKKGEEEIAVAGKTFKCKWISAGLSVGGRNMQGKSWMCNDIPGGIAQIEMKGAEMQSSMKLETLEVAK